MKLTPYAVLLVRPSDDDDTIRRAFHALSKQLHPDALVGNDARHELHGSLRTTTAKPPDQWYVVVGAYSAVKTREMRDQYHRYIHGLSGVCAKCDGAGVHGGRSLGGSIKICESCQGEGRSKKEKRCDATQAGNHR